MIGVWSVTGRNFTRNKIRNVRFAGICGAILLLFVFGGNSSIQNVAAKVDQEVLQEISTQLADKVAVVT